MFHWIEKEMAWRKERGQPEGFDTLRKTKPFGTYDFTFLVLNEMLILPCTVAVGAQEPLADQIVMADYFRESHLDTTYPSNVAHKKRWH